MTPQLFNLILCVLLLFVVAVNVKMWISKSITGLDVSIRFVSALISFAMALFLAVGGKV